MTLQGTSYGVAIVEIWYPGSRWVGLEEIN